MPIKFGKKPEMLPEKHVIKEKREIIVKPVASKRKPKDKYELVGEGVLIQLIIDINKEIIKVPDYVRHFFQNNTTDRGPFRGKRDSRKGGRIDGTVRQVLNALVDSKKIYTKE